MRKFFRVFVAISLFGSWAIIAMPLQALVPPQAIIWTMGNLTVPAYSNDAVGVARSNDRFNEAPILLRWEVSADRVRAVMYADIVCGFEVNASPICDIPLPPGETLQVNLPALAPGTYTLEITNYDSRISVADQTRILTVLPTPPVVNVVSVDARVLITSTRSGDHKFFMSANEADIADLVTIPPNLYNAKAAIAEPITLRAWPTAGPAADAAKPVCRLFHPTEVTHFFSASAADCAAIRALPTWRDEGIAFRALVPDAGGVCPIGTEPVWRLYSSKFKTHRYTRSSATYTGFKANGWTPEGVVFCSAPG